MDDAELVQRAVAVRKNAYCPYSNFPVGAALLCADGSVYTGVNVENAVNGLSICAERVAIFTAVTNGHHDFVKLAVVCDKHPCAPCGACRQVIYEHAPNIEILMGSPDGSFERTTIKELLPKAFELRD